MNDEETLKIKKLFAARLLQIDLDNPQEIFKVATEFRPDHMGEALRIAQTWPQDPDVIAERIRLTNEGFGVDEKEKIKKECIDLLLAIARDKTKWPEDRIKAIKELGSISGIVQDNKTNINVNNTTNVTQNRVMVVNNHGNDDEWEAQLMQQQEKLVHESAPRVVN